MSTRVRLRLHVLADGSGRVGAILGVHVVGPARPELALRLSPTARAVVAELAAALLALIGQASTADRSVAVLCHVCMALRLADGSVEVLAARHAVPAARGAEGHRTALAARDAAVALLRTAEARWAVVWSLLCSLHMGGLHDATACAFVHALATSLGVPRARVLATQDCLASELGLCRAPQAEACAGAEQPSGGSRGVADASSESACTAACAADGAPLIISDAPVGTRDRRSFLILSAIGGGAAFAFGGPLSGVALAGSVGSKAAFLVGAAASTLTAHYALEADARLLPAERRGGCEHGGSDLCNGLGLTIYCGPAGVPRLAGAGGGAARCGIAPSAFGAARPLLARHAASRAQDAERAAVHGAGGERPCERESDVVRLAWRAAVLRSRWGEHRVLQWQTSELLHELPPALAGLERAARARVRDPPAPAGAVDAAGARAARTAEWLWPPPPQALSLIHI